VIRRRPGLLGLGLAAPNKETPGSLSLRPAVSSSDWRRLLFSEREALIPARDGQLKPPGPPPTSWIVTGPPMGIFWIRSTG